MRRTAKMAHALSCSESPRFTPNWFTAQRASGFNGWCTKVWIVFVSQMHGAPLIPAITRAKEVIVSLYLGWVTRDLFAALRALHLNHCSLVSWCSLAGLSFLPLTSTGVVAKVALFPLGMASISPKGFSAPMARYICSAVPAGIVFPAKHDRFVPCITSLVAKVVNVISDFRGLAHKGCAAASTLHSNSLRAGHKNTSYRNQLACLSRAYRMTIEGIENYNIVSAN